MAVNRDKVDRWKSDVAASVDFYNEWFLRFAPKTFRDTRVATTHKVEQALKWTENLTNIGPDVLKQHPGIVAMLRMTTCPPLARDRLAGLAGVSRSLVTNMEGKGRISVRMSETELMGQLSQIAKLIDQMSDMDIVVWKNRGDKGCVEEVTRAAYIIADRLCAAEADPIVRNAQEQRQLFALKKWLEGRGYRELQSSQVHDWRDLPNGTFCFRLNVKALRDDGKNVNIPIDAVIQRFHAKDHELPALIEAKSAGDFANTNKRRKEEAVKVQQLRRAYGEGVTFDLLLCGYFDASYLGYEAAEGIDWVWEHRMDDLKAFGF